MISTQTSNWNVKLLWFLVPSIIGSAAFWFFVQQALHGHAIFNHVPLINTGLFLLMGIVCLAIWLGPLLLLSYVASSRSVLVLSVAMTVIPFLFFSPLLLWTFVALVVMFIGLAWGMRSVANDTHNRLTIQPLSSLSQGVSVVMLAVLVAISLMYFQQLRVSHSSSEDFSTSLIEQTVNITERTLPTFYKGYHSGMTIDELIGAQIPTAEAILKDINFDAFTTQAEQQQALQQKLEQLGLDPSVITVDVRQGEASVRQQIDDKLQEFHAQTVDQARQELAKRLDIPLQGSDTVHDALTRVVAKQFNQYVRRYVTFVPILLALGLFFALRVLTSLLQASVVWFGWLYLRLCRSFKLIHITHLTVPAEKVEWAS